MADGRGWRFFNKRNINLLGKGGGYDYGPLM